MSAEKDESGEPQAKQRRTDVKLSDLKVEVLISEVQSRECLWNDLHQNFKNSALTRKLWNEIGASLDIPGDEAKKKWKNLKDKYRKLIQKPPKSGSAAITQKNKWRFFESMQFTKDSMMPGQTFGNLRASFEKCVNSEAKDELENTLNMDSEEEDDQTSTFPDAEIGASIPTANTSKVKDSANSGYSTNFSNARLHRSKSAASSKTELEKEMVQLEKQKLNAILGIQKNSQKREDDSDDYHFVMSILPFMKHLDPVLKLELRGKIQAEVMHSFKLNQEMASPQPVISDESQLSNYTPSCQPLSSPIRFLNL